MKIMQLLKSLVLVTLFFGPLAAEESDPLSAALSECEKVYDACVEKCDKAEDGSEKCYESCGQEYDKCIILAEQIQ
jgi:hypothetical protein